MTKEKNCKSYFCNKELGIEREKEQNSLKNAKDMHNS